MFWRCLHRRALVFVPFIRMVDSDYFSPDYDLIRGVGRITKASELSDELMDFYSHPLNHRFARRRLGLRISVGRLSRIVHESLPRSLRRQGAKTQVPSAGEAP